MTGMRRVLLAVGCVVGVALPVRAQDRIEMDQMLRYVESVKNHRSKISTSSRLSELMEEAKGSKTDARALSALYYTASERCKRYLFHPSAEGLANVYATASTETAKAADWFEGLEKKIYEVKLKKDEVTLSGWADEGAIALYQLEEATKLVTMHWYDRVKTAMEAHQKIVYEDWDKKEDYDVNNAATQMMSAIGYEDTQEVVIFDLDAELDKIYEEKRACLIRARTAAKAEADVAAEMRRFYERYDRLTEQDHVALEEARKKEIPLRKEFERCMREYDAAVNKINILTGKDKEQIARYFELHARTDERGPIVEKEVAEAKMSQKNRENWDKLFPR